MLFPADPSNGIIPCLSPPVPKDLQTILRSNAINNESTETEMLTKMKAIKVTTQHVLVNVNVASDRGVRTIMTYKPARCSSCCSQNCFHLKVGAGGLPDC